VPMFLNATSTLITVPLEDIVYILSIVGVGGAEVTI
jgi:hypothetical protein